MLLLLRPLHMCHRQAELHRLTAYDKPECVWLLLVLLLLLLLLNCHRLPNVTDVNVTEIIQQINEYNKLVDAK